MSVDRIYLRTVVSLALLLPLAVSTALCAPADPPAPTRIVDGQALAVALEEAVTQLRAGRYDSARQRFERLVAELPPVSDSANAAFRYGLGSTGEYRKLLGSIHVNTALCALRKRDFEQARAGYLTALRVDPSSVLARRGVAIVRLRTRDYESAHQDFLRLATSAHARIDDFLHLGIAARHTARADEARWALNRAAAGGASERSPRAWGAVFEARRELAALAFELGRDAEALELVTALTDAVPGEPQLLYLAARVLERTGDEAAASAVRSRFDRAATTHGLIQETLAAPPFTDDQIRRVATLYRQLGILDLAHVHLRRLAQRRPEDPKLLFELRELRRSISTSPLFEPGV